MNVCKHFLNKTAPDTVTVTTVDRLGLDLRVKARDLTDEFRIGFRQPVSVVSMSSKEAVRFAPQVSLWDVYSSTPDRKS